MSTVQILGYAVSPFALIYTWKAGSKSKLAWWAMFIFLGGIVWVDGLLHLWGLLGVGVLQFGIAIRGLRKWSKEKENDSTRNI